MIGVLDRVHAINGRSMEGGLNDTVPQLDTSTTLVLTVSPPPEEGLTRWRSAVFELTLERDSTEGFGLG